MPDICIPFIDNEFYGYVKKALCLKELGPLDFHDGFKGISHVLVASKVNNGIS